MEICDVYLALGPERLNEILRCISLGKLKTFQLFDRIRTRLHLTKLNQESLRKVGPRVWARIQARETDLAAELAQAILVSHMDMITGVLNHLGVPHSEGFFEKEADIKQHLTDGWQQRVYDAFRGKYPDALLVFYLNHLGHEVNPDAPVFLPAGA